MNPRTGFYRHPYATMVTVVFLFTLLVTVLYFFDSTPGVRKTQRRLTELLIVTVILLVATAGSWITAIILRSDDA